MTAASRPICGGCERGLGEAGVGIASVLKSGNAMTIGANLPTLGFWEAAGAGALFGQGSKTLFDMGTALVGPYSGGQSSGFNTRATK